jgi:CheY-like chemotaxis protein
MERKKILLVEDDNSILRMLEEAIDPYSEIIRVRAVDEALGAFKENGPFDCFIVDLQIVPKGLAFDKMVDYQNREGYAFLLKIWEGKSQEEISKLKAKTIICSGFIEDFKKEHTDDIKGLLLVDKNKDLNKLSLFVNRIVENDNQ